MLRFCPLAMLPESIPVASRCVGNLKPVPQDKAPRQVNRPLYKKTEVCVSVCSLCSTLEGGSLPRTISLIVKVQWDPGMQAPLATRGRQSRTVPQCILHTPTGFSKAAGETKNHERCWY